MKYGTSASDVSDYVALGEYCLLSAPRVDLPSGQECVPQQFYGYNHCLESVESILELIDFPKHFPVFCSQDEQGLFIQVGVIGRENYQRSTPDRARKIVYGRKWRVEKNLPTSEIIQTVFLALKKAREHEIRELLTLKSVNKKSTSTPFNSHHDLPLMAKNPDLFNGSDVQKVLISSERINQTEPSLFTLKAVQQHLDLLSFNHASIECLEVAHKRNGKVLVDIRFKEAKSEQKKDTEFSELHDIESTLLLEKPDFNELFYSLMDTIIQLSDRYVEEHFSFNGFKRFSRSNNLREIGEFSIHTRLIKNGKLNDEGKQLISKHNNDVDESRAPQILLNRQNIRLSDSFEEYQKIEGFLPKGFGFQP